MAWRNTLIGEIAELFREQQLDVEAALYRKHQRARRSAVEARKERRRWERALIKAKRRARGEITIPKIDFAALPRGCRGRVLTVEQRTKIREAYLSREVRFMRDLAMRYDVSVSHISRIVGGKRKVCCG